METLVIVGLIVILIACLLCDITAILLRKKLRDLVYWSEAGYELAITDNKQDFVNTYNNTEQGKYCPAYINNDEVFVKGRLGDHKITWLGNKVYSDRSYISELNQDYFKFFHFFRFINWIRSIKFSKQIDWVHDGICVMEVIAKAYDPNHAVPKLATGKTATYKGIIPIGLIAFLIGVGLLLVGLFIDFSPSSSETITADQSVNEELEKLKEENDKKDDMVEEPTSTPEPTATPEPTPEPDYTYIIDDSDSKYLKEKDLKGLSKSELRLARNEIFARHGCIFKDKSLNKFFKKKAWYTPEIKISKFSEKELNKYEKANIQLIADKENGVTPQSWLGSYFATDSEAEFDVIDANSKGVTIASMDSEGGVGDQYFCTFTKGYSYAEYDEDGWTGIKAHKDGNRLYITMIDYYEGTETSYTLQKY